jgi:FtsP/CotA-like multicopper oxidase with cupredoxin domain
MLHDYSLTRRRALLLSGAAAAAATLEGLPLAALAAQDGPKLPIPALIDARDGETVALSLQRSRHRFGSGPVVPSSGISASYLGPVVRVRSGDTVRFKVENRLDEETTLHWHGLHIPSHLDGGPHNVIAPGGTWSPEITFRQPAATTWFHPHPHGNTARQVYAGLAGMMILGDGGDRDRGLPATYGVDDLPLTLQDKRFGRSGEPVYAPTMMDLMHGFLGDTLLVNGAVGPVARVPAGLVRLRLLNAANARIFDLRFADRRPFFVIAGDAGLLAEPVEVRRLTVAPAERYEILVDFADGLPADLVTGPSMHGMGPDATTMAGGHLMRFRPDSDLPAAVTRLPHALTRVPPPDIASAVAWRTFVLDPMFGMGMGMGMGMMAMPVRQTTAARDAGHDHAAAAQMMGINGRAFAMDRVDVTAKRGTAEIWEIVSAAMAHPFHVHGASFRVLANNGRKPAPEQSGWKDVVLVEQQAEILVRFDHPAPPKMPFMYHCHILEHEDHGMMGQLSVV